MEWGGGGAVCGLLKASERHSRSESEFDSEIEANTGQIKTDDATVPGRATGDCSGSRAQTKQPLVRPCACVLFSSPSFLSVCLFCFLSPSSSAALGSRREGIKTKAPNKSKYKVFTFPAKPVV